MEHQRNKSLTQRLVRCQFPVAPAVLPLVRPALRLSPFAHLRSVQRRYVMGGLAGLISERTLSSLSGFSVASRIRRKANGGAMNSVLWRHRHVFVRSMHTFCEYESSRLSGILITRQLPPDCQRRQPGVQSTRQKSAPDAQRPRKRGRRGSAPETGIWRYRSKSTRLPRFVLTNHGQVALHAGTRFPA